MFAVFFICGNLFLRIAWKIAKLAKIRTRKNFVPHGSRKFSNFSLENFGNLPKWLGIVGKWPKTSWYTENNIALFGAFFCFLLDKIYSYREFFTFSVEMPKITEPKKIKCLVLSMYPHSDPPINPYLNGTNKFESNLSDVLEILIVRLI